ncbi:MAG: zinc ribbon domain-containing protein, partial [Myxococcota bacterium]
VGPSSALLELFCHALEHPSEQIRRLQRKLERQRRANNPENYTAEGKIRPGKKVWHVYKAMNKTRAALREFHRKLAVYRKCLHNHLVNRLLQMGDTFRLEKLSYRSFQKNFGRSVSVRAPGTFVSRLKCKAESAGAKVEECSTYRTALSQRCHCGRKQKKPLRQRVHECCCGAYAQRDLYSAFLARFVESNQLQVSKAALAWKETEAFLSTTWKQAKDANGGRRVSSFGTFRDQRQSASCSNVFEKLDQVSDVVPARRDWKPVQVHDTRVERAEKSRV